MSKLSPLTGPVVTSPFLTLDIESKDGSSRTKAGFTRPFLVGVYDGESYHEFRDLHPTKGRWQTRYFWEDGCVAQALRHVLSDAYSGYRIYAHNAGRFDYLFFLSWLMEEGERLGYRFSIIPVSSSIQLLDVWKLGPDGRKAQTWRFLDSIRLIPTSLQKAGKAFGLGGKVEHDLNRHENDPLWSVYLKQDCVLLYNVVSRFHDYIENVLGGEVGITAPSTAMKLYRRKYLKSSIPRTPDSHEFIREGYVGGRVECFYATGENLRYYDINSSYPRAMLDPMPAGEGVYWQGKPAPFLADSCIGFVRANVDIPEDIAIPPLPTHDPDNGKLIFPVGRLSGVWEWGELQQAMSMGVRVEEWRDSWWYEQRTLFNDYVTDLYKYRDKSLPGFDPGLAEICKIMLNSLYGKFGMKTQRKMIYRFDDPNLPDDAVPANNDPDCPVWYAEKTVDAAYIMPQISARVTALARVRLLRAMLSAIELGGKVYYCDTDSVLTDVRLPTGSKLGELKDEYPEQSGNIRGRFLGPKLYVLTSQDWEKVTAKGFETRTVETIEKLLAGETIVQWRLEKVGTLARNNFMRGPRMVPVPRSLRQCKGKREALPDGSSKPWRLDMW